jgi:hypothetical protein
MPMYLLRISSEQTELDGDALVRLLPFEHDTQQEFIAEGRLTGIDTAWQCLDELFQGASQGPAAHLPVLGGRAAECTGDAPVLVLGVAEVAAAAEFLAGSSFDQLFATNRAPVEAAHGGSLSGDEIDDLRHHFDDLKGFYGAAKLHGDAVMKWVAF